VSIFGVLLFSFYGREQRRRLYSALNIPEWLAHDRISSGIEAYKTRTEWLYDTFAACGPSSQRRYSLRRRLARRRVGCYVIYPLTTLLDKVAESGLYLLVDTSIRHDYFRLSTESHFQCPH
jgi:hypothetical protein